MATALLFFVLALGACSGGDSNESEPGEGGTGGETSSEVGAGGTDASGGSDSTGSGGVDSSAGGSGTGGDVSGTGGVDLGGCSEPPPSTLTGWAAEAGGTTGGGSAQSIIVTNPTVFQAAVAGTTPAVIYVNGTLSTNSEFVVGSNKTIIGICGAEIHGSIMIKDAQNVIMRNLKVVGNNCEDSPSDCSGGRDAISVRNSHHLWFDHLDVSDGSDGNLDMTTASDYITISWTKFWYTGTSRDHRFSNLIGGSDSDAGDYRITFHHNWWADNADQRMPRTRFGDIHVYNNLYTSSGNSYCTNAGYDTRVLVENNVYIGVNNPLSPDDNGDMRAEGNVFTDTSGNTSDDGGSGFTPSYSYSLDATDGLEAAIKAGAGPQN